MPRKQNFQNDWSMWSELAMTCWHYHDRLLNPLWHECNLILSPLWPSDHFIVRWKDLSKAPSCKSCAIPTHYNLQSNQTFGNLCDWMLFDPSPYPAFPPSGHCRNCLLWLVTSAIPGLWAHSFLIPLIMFWCFMWTHSCLQARKLVIQVSMRQRYT